MLATTVEAMTSPTTITDPADPRLDDIRDLNRSDAGGEGLVIAEGPLVISRLVESRFPLRMLAGFEHKIQAYLEEYGDPGCPIYHVSRETLAQVAGFDMHRGLVAAADRLPPQPVAEVLAGARTLAVLEGVGDHENIGAIFRNAAALGVDGVLLGSGAADPLYRRSIRVSMGHVLRLPFGRFSGGYTTWHRELSTLAAAGFQLISLTPQPQAPTIEQALNGVDKVAFLLGAEGPGLSEHAMRATHTRARIPMAAGTDSLNVATAAAVAFYARSVATPAQD